MAKPATKTMSFFKYIYPTEAVTDHEMNFRHLFPFFFYFWKNR